MRHLLVLLALSGCGGLTSLSGETDDYGNPDADTDSGLGHPLDSANHDGTDDAPIADAGDDLTVAEGDVVDLDGSGSTDPDGDDLTYRWALTKRPVSSTAELIDDHSVHPTFWADVPGTYEVELTVDDGELTSTDDVTVTAEAPNGAPTANAGADQTVSVGDTVQLDGSGSADPDGDGLHFAWTMTLAPSGSTAALNDPTSVLPRFTADLAGTYEIHLVVDDGKNDSAPDIVRVVAQDGSTGDCLGCAAARDVAKRRLAAGDLAAGPGLVLLPLLVLFLQRKKPLSG